MRCRAASNANGFPVSGPQRFASPPSLQMFPCDGYRCNNFISLEAHTCGGVVYPVGWAVYLEKGEVWLSTS